MVEAKEGGMVPRRPRPTMAGARGARTPRTHTWSRVEGLEFGFFVQGVGLRFGVRLFFEGVGLRIQGSGFTVSGSGFKVQGLGFRVERLNCKLWGLGFGLEISPVL